MKATEYASPRAHARVSSLLLSLLATTHVACGSEALTERRSTNASTDAPCAASPSVGPSQGTAARDGGTKTGAPNVGPLAPEALAVGGAHACFLHSGAVKCWGYNYFGQLGYGDDANRGDKSGDMGTSLRAIDFGGKAAVSIAAGENHTCAILDDASVVCWGNNSKGQLGRGDAIPTWGDATHQMGTNLVPVPLGAGQKAVALTLGFEHSCALLQGGSVKCWGDNGSGQLGLGDTVARGTSASDMGDALPRVDFGGTLSAKSIVAGGLHTCAILSDDSLKCWGDNRNGQLGLGDRTNRGSAAGSMGSSLPSALLGSDVMRVVQVAAGTYNTCAIVERATSTTSLKCWGDNWLGQLGSGDTQDRGGTSQTVGSALAPVDLGAGVVPASIAIGWDHACAKLIDGSAKCWGENLVGQLGLGDTASRGRGPGEMGNALPMISFGAGAGVVEIAIGISHSCAHLEDGSVKCWGFNAAGQLGLGAIADVGDDAGETGYALQAVDLAF